jgi:ribosomal protein L21E
MNKALVTIGVFALIIGILLTALPFVYIPSHTTQAYQIPKSEVIVDGWTPIAAVAPATSMAKGIELTAGDSLNIQVNATAGKGINFYVNSGVTGLVYPYSGTATELTYQNVTTLNKDWTVPVSSQYSFVFNSTNLFSYKDVSLLVTKQWSDTAYREVTQNVQLLPFQIFYLGLGLAFSGLAILVYANIKRKQSA